MKKKLLHEVKAGPYRIRGVSVAGIYTSLQVPELGVLFDAGIALRSLAGSRHWLFSHGHADHMGALPAMLGIRHILRMPPPTVMLPAEIAAEVRTALAGMAALHGYPLAIELVPMSPGDEHRLRKDLWVRAFRTHHRVPSLGYLLLRKTRKLKPELASLPGAEIGARRRAGEDIFYQAEHHELAYATDTLHDVLETAPELLESRVLVLECTFLDERKTLEASRAGGHIHLDELLPYADRFRNAHLVLMHFSQLYSPAEVHAILARRCPPAMLDRLVPFAAPSGDWPG
jgi:ribonuclease Z